MKKYMGRGSNLLSIVACCAIFFAVNAGAIEEKKLQAVEVNSAADRISESGIAEGILNKSVASGPLAGKKIQDTPYQINTVSRQLMDNQMAQQPQDLIKFFPSAQIQYRFGPEIGRPETRGFQADVIGNMLWDGFYVLPMTSIPMAMFESVQVQNGLAGSLYGGQAPSGIFSYTRKRPVELQNIIWSDYSSREHLGIGLDTSDKFEKIGYRGVFYYSNGEKQTKQSKYSRRLASLGLDFYLTDELTLETNYSYFRHKMFGMPTSFAIKSTNGNLNFAIPDPVENTAAGLGQPFAGSVLTTQTASAKFKYAPNEKWYFEGGYQWHSPVRNMNTARNTFINAKGDYTVSYSERDGGVPNPEVRSYFVKTTTDFETAWIKHNFAAAFNGYRQISYTRPNIAGSNNNIGMSNLYDPIVLPEPNLARGGGAKRKSGYTDMNNVSVVDDIAFNDKFNLVLSLSKSWFSSESIKTNGDKVKNYSQNGNSYAASFIYKPVENLSLYVTYADSIRAGSSFTYQSTHPLYPNQTVYLKPNRSKQYEIGAKARVGETDISTALFKIERPIAYESVGSSGYSEFAEQGKQVNQGFEMTAGGKLTQDLGIFGGFMLLNAKLKETKNAYAENKIVIGQPKFRANVLFDYTVPSTNKLAFSANFHYTGKQYADEINNHRVDGYFLTDLGVRYVTKQWLGKETILRFNVNNVFNEKYWASLYPNSVDGTSNSTWFFLGQSRTFMLSAQVKF
ncbi:TonB-dependent receptor [Campylobacter curvus]|uniref:TonB-dependent receptor n=1 Tax=Campylobacter curvus TaxID=200 RepID=UPI0014705E4D|nr:TonB-dependent receptor [Campylobacter curvus]